MIVAAIALMFGGALVSVGLWMVWRGQTMSSVAEIEQKVKNR